MKDHHLASLRIYNQQIHNPQFKTPEDVVKYMVAMQAQDYAGAKWAIGLRMKIANENFIEQAIGDGKILRTHLLRPTWHFVLPQDIRWILNLTAPRIKAANAGMYKKFGVDDAIFNKSNNTLAKALEGDKQLTRPELVDVLQKAGIATDELRFTMLLMQAELDQVICSGKRVGKQFTYALLDDRAPAYSPLKHEEALTKLAAGYFNSRGPATVHDFAAWSGLTVTDATTGLENIKAGLINEVIEGKTYWMPDHEDLIIPKNPKAHLLPMYDEFAIAYKHRDALVKPPYLEQARHVIFEQPIIVDDQVVGTWRRTLKKTTADITLNLFGKLNKTQTKAVETAITRYQKFLF
ncbi:winged helix DNA-binding domain-containing protein [Mucilaginibacter sabulilitoris]|uniref:Winged helix DNA-binding domain-containing protein n=1 Tax=Mucilaginibacter sabulilitoris TaxID=1173583 RepID=A0ABZ0TEI2_9SPHI|nr:winged helix DNA-binding domain-containing protein [Mucilaginibacter sabulilitoris]WPU91201.1 winged helix DNA-binding domain-containing protein [Mucilaginibacter sabulilitoris]